MTPEEQAFITARDDMQRLIQQFTQSPQAAAYMEGKRRVIEAWLHEYYPDTIFRVTSIAPRWRATVESGDLDFAVDIVALSPVESGRLFAILAEVRAYLARLGNDGQSEASLQGREKPPV